MLNAEKFKDEITKLGFDFTVKEDGTVVGCTICNECKECKFCRKKCIESRIEWLLEEYKEPLLTEEEQQILHNILKVDEVLNGGIIAIAKKRRYSSHGEQYYFSFSYANDNVSSFNFNGNEMFKGLKLNKEYTIKELGLWQTKY